MSSPKEKILILQIKLFFVFIAPPLETSCGFIEPDSFRNYKREGSVVDSAVSLGKTCEGVFDERRGPMVKLAGKASPVKRIPDKNGLTEKMV